MFNWLKKKLGIDFIDSRLQRLEELEHFTLADVVDRLSESFIVLANDSQYCINNDIHVPVDKSGVLVLGETSSIVGCRITSVPYKITKETVI